MKQQTGSLSMLANALLTVALLWQAAHAGAGTKPESNTLEAMRASFAPAGQATMDRLDQDETQAQCSRFAPKPLPAAIANRLAALNRATIKPPADGNYLGDFRKGEHIAQTGTGFQSSDDPGAPAGGNCYACHEMAKSELAFGTIGPSLNQYGKTRGTSPEMLAYTWERLYNTKAFIPCSSMPRFGQQHILTESQLRDVMAFLFDPESPVNR